MTRVLIVEDNPMNMKLAVVLLEKAGYQVLQAFDAPSGIEVARTSQPDIVLMDIQLPGMDGLTALHELKRDPATAGIKVVAITAYAMRGDRERMLAEGCDGYIAKPFRREDLLETIARLETTADDESERR